MAEEVQSERKQLTGIFDAIAWSWNFLFAEKRWQWLLKAQLVYVAAMVLIVVLPALVIAGMVGLMIGSRNMSWESILVMVGMGLAMMVIVGGFSAAYHTGVFIELYNDRKPDIFELAKKSWRSFLGYFGLSMVVGSLTAIGLMLFIVPGIIWAITYTFAMNVKYEKGVGISEAMKESKAITNGYKWELFKKWGGLGLVMGLVSVMTQGVTQDNNSILLSLVALAASWVINSVGTLVFVKYYYELKK